MGSNHSFVVAFCIIYCLFIASSSQAIAPKLLDLPKQISLSENRSHIFSCTLSSGSQPIDFEWLKDHRPLLPSIDRYKIDTVDDLSSLTVRRAQPSDAGLFTCKATNQFGSDSTSSQLLINCELYKVFVFICLYLKLLPMSGAIVSFRAVV